MNKISLDMESLSVESFEVDGGEQAARGTVQAHEAAEFMATPGKSCYRTACCPETTLC